MILYLPKNKNIDIINYIYLVMTLSSIYNFIVKKICCYEDKPIKIETDIPVIVPVPSSLPSSNPYPSPESIDSNISSTLSKFFNRCEYFNRCESYETISELGLMRNNIKHFYNLSDIEKNNLYNMTEKEKIEIILLYDRVLYAIKQEYTFYPIEKT